MNYWHSKKEIPFEFLQKTIRVLICHSDAKIQTAISTILLYTPFYEIIIKPNTVQAIREISEKRIHLCIIDCSLEKLTILKKYQYIPFIAIPKNESTITGYLFSKAKDMINYEDIEKDDTSTKLFNYAILNLINPYRSVISDNVNLAIDLLFTKKPYNVTRWAIELGKTERQLRNILNPLNTTPKLLHFISTVYVKAMAYCNTNKLPKKYNNAIEYFYIHRSKFLEYIHRKL